MSISSRVTLLAALSMLHLVACSESSAEPEPGPAVGLLDISVDSATLAVGEWILPDVEVRDTAGAPLDRVTVEWVSSDEAVVAVDSVGTIVALAPGTIEVIASAGALQHRIEIRVPDIRGITLVPSTDSLVVGERRHFRVALDTDIPFNPAASRFDWEVSNPGTAHVNDLGVVTTRHDADFTVQATLGGVSGSASVRTFGDSSPFVVVAAGGTHSCALRASGLLYCWGAGDRLGLPVTEVGALALAETIPIPHDPDGNRYRRLSANFSAVCGMSDPSVFCWGWSGSGTFGTGAGGAGNFRLPVRLETTAQLVDVTLGSNHACGLDGDGAAWCWGGNTHGQLGDSTLVTRATTEPVAGGHTFTALAAGGAHTCGVRTDGALLCWGADADGAVTGGDTECQFSDGPCALTPRVVAGLPPMAAVAAGGINGFGEYSCGLDQSGGLHCWGSDYGEPHRMDERTYARIAAGPRHGCVLTPQGAAFCFGSNAHGKLANAGVGPGFATTPVPVYGDLRFAAISAGGEHTCGVELGGANLFCWGSNTAGQLGKGDLEPATVPREVEVP